MQESQETALMVAARWGNVEIVRKLIQYGASVNLPNKVTGLALIPIYKWKEQK